MAPLKGHPREERRRAVPQQQPGEGHEVAMGKIWKQIWYPNLLMECMEYTL